MSVRGGLEVKQLVTMHNASKPPRTLMNDRPFSIQLPPEAQVLSGLVQLGDGEPLKSKPAPGERKGEYAFRITGTGTLAELQGRQQPSRSDSVQPVGQPDQGFQTSPGTSRRDKLILSGLGVVLLVFSVVFIVKTRARMPASVEPEVLLVQSRRGQKNGRRKRRVRVSQQYSH